MCQHGGMKEYDPWNEKKKILEQSIPKVFCHSREIWWCSLGLNIGKEQDGGGEGYERPVLILKTLSQNTCLVVPLTSSVSQHPFRIPIGNIDGVNSSVILSQVKTVDTRRFSEKIRILEKDVFDVIRKAIKDML